MQKRRRLWFIRRRGCLMFYLIDINVLFIYMHILQRTIVKFATKLRNPHWQILYSQI